MWFLVLLMLSTSAAAQQPRCDAHDELVAKLKAKFNEDVAIVGVTLRGALIEILASGEGSWTILITPPSRVKVTCIIEAGEGLELIIPSEPS